MTSWIKELMGRILSKAGLVGGLLASSSALFPAQAQEAKSLDVYLFGKNVIESYKGCHVAFWQKTRDPKKNKYAYIFYCPLQ